MPPIHKSRGLSIADHWSSICRPIIGKVPTKISNVSPQIIKHQRGPRTVVRLTAFSFCVLFQLRTRDFLSLKNSFCTAMFVKTSVSRPKFVSIHGEHIAFKVLSSRLGLRFVHQHLPRVKDYKNMTLIMPLKTGYNILRKRCVPDRR